VIFLAGLGRSGTTLLERALAELPGVRALGEVVHLWQRGIVDDELCGCGTPFGDCPFWSEVGTRAFDGWKRVDLPVVMAARKRADHLRRIPQLALGHGRRGVSASAATLAAHHRRIYDAVAESSGAAAVVDSSKHPSLAYCLRHDSSIDLRVVHVVRDSRGVAYSWTKTVERPDARSSRSERFMTRYTPSRSALLWSVHNASLAMLDRLGVPLKLVRYESFLRSPAETLAEVARFAGIETTEADLGFVSDETITLQPAHTVAGNPLRFATGTLELRRDDAWRASLPQRDRLTVTALTYPQLYRYGYVGAAKERAA
jgi:hypothetical protein